MRATKEVKSSGVSVVALALKLGPKGRSASDFAHPPPPGALVRVKLFEGVATRSRAQAVIRVVVVFGPQVGGLVSVPLAPSNWSLKELNGTCGRPPWAGSSKLAVSRPVSGSATTSPSRRT